MNSRFSSCNEISILEDGIPVQQVKSYGIGIDCHSKFIQVCVLAKRNLQTFSHQKEFPTDWTSLQQARDWCIQILSSKTEPLPDLSLPLHFCIESTATYHLPVVLAFGGTPSIINPTLVGSAKRKTDVLDAQTLATHDLIGIWKETYLPSTDIHDLRVLIAERARCLTESTAASRRINNTLVRFGYTLGRDGSVAKPGPIRDLIEAILNGESDLPAELCPLGIPSYTRQVLISEYKKFDQQKQLASYWAEASKEKILSMQWETDTSTLSGQDILSLLMTAPQVGELTAMTWLAHIITPRRFPNGKAIAAYCGLDPSLKVSAGKVTSTRKRGGNKELHSALVSSTDRLIRNHTEMFGRWGYNLYCQNGKWKKAANAVARKLAIALYFIMKTGQPFSYENYHLMKEISLLDIPITELPAIEPDFKRYIRILQEHHIYTTSQLLTAYLSCQLGSFRGLGRKFFSVLRHYINEQHTYKKLYEEYKQHNHHQEDTNDESK